MTETVPRLGLTPGRSICVILGGSQEMFLTIICREADSMVASPVV
jgi:hypothetical protein